MSRSSVFGLHAVPQGSEVRRDVASWYTPGWTDALGDRLLMFDNTASSGLELLRFTPTLAEAPGFEDALRQRITHLQGLDHAAIAVTRSLRWLGDREGLALVSTHVVGRRLSEMLDEARGAGFAAEVIRQLAPAIAALHGHRPGLAHGTIAPPRIVVTAGGRLVLTEAPVGGALAALGLSAARLRADFSIPLRDEAMATLGPAQDLYALGHLAMSLLVGRPLPADVTADRLTTMLEHQAAMPWGPGFVHLRTWLERALHLSTPFSSAAEAERAMASWPEGELSPIEQRPRLVVRSDADAAASAEASVVTRAARPPLAGESAREPAAHAVRRPAPMPGSLLSSDEPAASTTDAASSSDASSRQSVVRLLSAVALLEAVVIVVLGWLLLRQPAAAPPPDLAGAPPVDVAAAVATPEAAAAAPETPTPGTGRVEITSDPPGARVTVDGSGRGVTPLTLALSPGDHNIVLTAGAATTRRTVSVTAGSNSTLIASLPSAGAAAGWVAFNTPLDLQVSEGGQVIGTTRATRLMLPAGSHRLELSNATLGIQTTMNVTVEAGATTTARVAVPNGSLSLNALPWANVWLNNQSLGTTPFANLSVPVGTHEIVWRHPQFGERRQTVVVSTKAPVRVVMDLTK